MLLNLIKNETFGGENSEKKLLTKQKSLNKKMKIEIRTEKLKNVKTRNVLNIQISR